MFRRTILLLTLCFFLSSCGSSNDRSGDNSDESMNEGLNESSESQAERLEFLSHKATCRGLFQRLCLRTGNNEVFFDPIEGFEFVWGHAYELSVNVSEVQDPAGDASSLRYVLEEMISDTEDSVGRIYEYERVDLLENTFTKDSDDYYFLGQPFGCRTGVDCDGLVNINNSGGSVNVVFEYAGNGGIILTSWN